MQRGNFQLPLTRREMLLRCANGFGAVALTALLAEDGRGSPDGLREADRVHAVDKHHPSDDHAEHGRCDRARWSPSVVRRHFLTFRR